ncbi:helix-turn-helix domain-containing protein [Hydrogenophaga flava]|uniref:helix-turn-helix domain-containing protein n=1 Tax=Hydrogenophaga flava TaxID=65657 RepID=UPI000825D912|nr:helix-turn-helix domain-containing protein [Hydrogenophaga flava]
MRATHRTLSTQDLPPQPFFQTPEQRAALARQRFFEEQQHPAGLVSEAVIRSWGRSRALGHASHKMPALDPVNRSALSAALARNRRLLEAAHGDLQQLEAALAGTASRLMLTDANGVIVHASRGTGDPEQKVLDAATRVGVHLAEEVLGTTAPGIVVQTGMACTVQGCEHFYELFGQVRCAAAPIHDVHGRLVGVLDVSTESRAFGFDAAAVVGVYATSIENRLLQAQSDEHLVLHFQAAPALLGTPMEGLAGVDHDGRVVWVNATGHSLLGRPSRQDVAPVEELFGHGLAQLMPLCGATEARRLQLPSGLGIWLRATLGLRDGIDFRHAVAWPATMPPAPEPLPAAEPEVPTPAPVAAPSLAQTQQRLIEDALQANGGNVARTARQLGVSRGLVYRHLQK